MAISKSKPAPAPAPAPPVEKDPTDNAEAENVEKRPAFYLLERKSVTTIRGILSDGDEITPDDLVGGKQRLAELIKSGHVGKG